MKQLLILSGKGGTGKTTIASSFITLAQAEAYADCDVDAPNLHLVVQRTDEGERKDYFGMAKAVIDAKKCQRCGQCQQHCLFHAISRHDGNYAVDDYHCEGCAVCTLVCPSQAVTMEQQVSGQQVLYREKPVFSTAQLKMGSGNSGMLVTQVKKAMKKAAKGAEMAIVDGSPGTGCPVIASLSGVDMVLIVTEPSLSGMSDLQRIIQTAEIFKPKIAVCINRYDTCPAHTAEIEQFCQQYGLAVAGKIPFDVKAITAVNQGQPLVTVEDSPAAAAIRATYERTMELFWQKDSQQEQDQHKRENFADKWLLW